MPSHFPLFDRSRLRLRPLSQRQHDLTAASVLELRPVQDVPPKIRLAAEAIARARARQAPVVFMMGAHVIRAGVQRYLIDLMERGYISSLAGNGACLVHDFELSVIGATTESVARYLSQGQFGLWSDLDELNQALEKGAGQGWGAGETGGRLIEEKAPPFIDISLFAAAWRLRLPFTVHISVGQDILHELPGCSGAALGQTSYTDFLIMARALENLEGGVFCNFGSAVTGPEIFLKALAMARNVGGPTIGPRRFTTLVCDLHDLPEEVGAEANKANPLYYYRPWKTILARSVADGGDSFYVKGRHDQTIPALWSALMEIEKVKKAARDEP